MNRKPLEISDGRLTCPYLTVPGRQMALSTVEGVIKHGAGRAPRKPSYQQRAPDAKIYSPEPRLEKEPDGCGDPVGYDGYPKHPVAYALGEPRADLAAYDRRGRYHRYGRPCYGRKHDETQSCNAADHHLQKCL